MPLNESAIKRRVEEGITVGLVNANDTNFLNFGRIIWKKIKYLKAGWLVKV